MFQHSNNNKLVVIPTFFAVAASTATNNGGGGGGAIAPIPNWQASWTASQASSTVMAMVYKDCIVMLIRSPSSNVWKGRCTSKSGCDRVQYSSCRNKEDDVPVVHGLPVEEADVISGWSSSSSSSSPLSNQLYSAPSPSWVSLPNPSRGQCTICAMTGLAVDVEHLYLQLRKECESYNVLKQHHLATTNTYTKYLAMELQQNCLSSNSRPYGVQALFVGCDGIYNPNNEDDKDSKSGSDCDDDDDVIDDALCIYSMDPSGSWQSWSKGTAIGKFGPELRYLLGKKLKRKERQQEANDDTGIVPSNNGLEDAVECLISCWKETCQQQDLNLSEPHEEEYTVLIIKRRRQSNKPKRSLPSALSSSSSLPPSKESNSAVADVVDAYISNRRQQRRINGAGRNFQCFTVPKSKLDEIADRVNNKLRNHIQISQ